MRFSEAIRLGSTLNRQGFGDSRVYGGVLGPRTCALGAALAAVGVMELPKFILSDEQYFAFIEKFWPGLRRTVQCPVGCNGIAISLDDLAVHLNDSHRWTRERIADEVARFEPVEMEVVAAQPEVTCPVFAIRV